MTVRSSIDPARLLEEQLAQASPDLLRELLGSFIQTLLSAEADAVCGAEYGTSSLERVNRRNRYRRTEGLPGDQLAAVPQGIRHRHAPRDHPLAARGEPCVQR